MLRSLQALLLLSLVALLGASSASARQVPVSLWIEAEGQRTEKRIPCYRKCSLLRKVIRAATAPRFERWPCLGNTAPAPFRAGASRRGRTLAVFVPSGFCGTQQWKMVERLYRKHLRLPGF